LWQDDAPKGKAAAHADGARRLDLSVRNRLEGTPENFGGKCAIDEAEGQAPGPEGMKVDDARMAPPQRKVLNKRRGAVVDQQDQEEFGDTAHHGRVGSGKGACRRGARELAPGAKQPEQDGKYERGEADEKRELEATQEHPAEAVQIRHRSPFLPAFPREGARRPGQDLASRFFFMRASRGNARCRPATA